MVGWLATMFGAFGVLMNSFLLLSGAPVLVEIRRSGSTGHYKFAPYLLNWANSFSWLIYSLHSGAWHAPTILICSFGGLATTTTFLVVYAANIGDDVLVRRSFFRAVPMTVLFLSFLALVSFMTQPSEVDFQAHWSWWKSVCVLCNIFVFFGPMLALREAWRRTSASRVPLKVGLASLMSASPWVGYAICAGETAVLLPNLFGVLLSIVQLTAHEVLLEREKFGGSNDKAAPLDEGPRISSNAAIVSTASTPATADAQCKTAVFRGRECTRENILVNDPWKQGLYTYGFLDTPRDGSVAFLDLLRHATEVELVELKPDRKLANASSQGAELQQTSTACRAATDEAATDELEEFSPEDEYISELM